MTTQYVLDVEQPVPLATLNGPVVTVSGKAYVIVTPTTPDGGDPNPRIVAFAATPDNTRPANSVTVSALGAQEVTCTPARILNTWSCQLSFTGTTAIQIKPTIKIIAYYGSSWKEEKTQTVTVNLDTKIRYCSGRSAGQRYRGVIFSHA